MLRHAGDGEVVESDCPHAAFLRHLPHAEPGRPGLALPGFLGSTINPDGKPMTTTPRLGPPRLDGRIATWDYVKRLKDSRAR